MKLSKTAMKELSARYRAVLKKCFLINMGIVLMAAPAMAEPSTLNVANGATETKNLTGDEIHDYITVETGGTLNITGDASNPELYKVGTIEKISPSTDVTIKGNLNITNSNLEAGNDMDTAPNNSNMLLEGATVNLTNSSMEANGDITIINATIDAKTTLLNNQFGLWSDKDITISGVNTDITLNNGTYIAATENITISDATVSVDGDSFIGSYDETLPLNVSINSGDFTLTNNGEISTDGGVLTINGGTFNISGRSGMLGKTTAISGADTAITLNDGWTTAYESFNFSDATINLSNGSGIGAEGISSEDAGTITYPGGTVALNSGTVNVKAGSNNIIGGTITSTATINIDAGATLRTVANYTENASTGDFTYGDISTIEITGGELNLVGTLNSHLKLSGGVLKLHGSSKFTDGNVVTAAAGNTALMTYVNGKIDGNNSLSHLNLEGNLKYNFEADLAKGSADVLQALNFEGEGNIMLNEITLLSGLAEDSAPKTIGVISATSPIKVDASGLSIYAADGDTNNYSATYANGQLTFSVVTFKNLQEAYAASGARSYNLKDNESITGDTMGGTSLSIDGGDAYSITAGSSAIKVGANQTLSIANVLDVAAEIENTGLLKLQKTDVSGNIIGGAGSVETAGIVNINSTTFSTNSLSVKSGTTNLANDLTSKITVAEGAILKGAAVTADNESSNAGTIDSVLTIADNAVFTNTGTLAGVTVGTDATLFTVGTVGDVGGSGTVNLTGGTWSSFINTGTVTDISGDVTWADGARVSKGLTVLDSGSLNIGTNTADLTGQNLTINGTLKVEASGLSADAAPTSVGTLTANAIDASSGKLSFIIDASKSTLQRDESTAEFKVITGLTSDFADANMVAKNNRFKVSASESELGSYKITYTASAGDIATDAGGNANDAGAADAWDAGSSSSDPDSIESKVINQLNILSQTVGKEKEYLETLRALAPEVAAKIQSVSTEVIGLVAKAIASRLSGGPITNTPSGDYMGNQGALWVQGLYSSASLDDTSAASGFDGDTYGFAIGAEMKSSDEFTAGITYAYTMSDVDGSGRTTDVDSNTFAVYGEYKPSEFFVNGSLSYGIGSYEESKNVSGVGVNADYDTDTFAINANVGYDIKIDRSAKVTPMAGLRYMSTSVDSYTDTAGQTVTSDDVSVLTGVVGASISNELLSNGVILKPNANIGFTYDFTSDEANSTVVLANTSSYTVSGEALDEFGVEFGLGLTAEFDTGIEISLDYLGQIRSDYSNHTGMLKAKYNF